MSIKPSLSIIIVTYRSKNYIVQCIDSINKNIPKKTNIEIIVIDNNSPDSTQKILEKINHGHLTKIFNHSNKGFAKAINQGIRKSKGDKVLLLNPDTTLKANSLQNLIKVLNNNVGICGGRMIGYDGSFRGSYFRLPTLMTGIFDFTNIRKIFPNNKWHKEFYFQDLNQAVKKTIEVGAVSGGYMLISRQVINKVGLLDEHFFMYLEDVDYCLRAKKANFKVLYCPLSVIKHEGGASSANRERANVFAWLDSRRYYFKKNHNRFENLIIQPIFLLDAVFIKMLRLFR